MKNAIGHLSEDVAQTRTLPARFYTNPDIFAAEKDALFLKSWHFACHVSDLPNKGSFVTLQIMGQQLFVVRGQDDEIRAFYNVCPHRGHRLLEGCGEKKIITSPYHAWSYDLTGRLVSAREGKERKFTGSDICVPKVSIGRILDLIFVNADENAAPFSTYTIGLEESIKAAVPGLSEYKMRENVGYLGGDYDCNWKIAIDNYLECYHCEVAHKSFCDMMDVKRSTFGFYGNCIYQFVPSGGKPTSAAYDIDLDEDAVDGHFWYLFPNIIFSVFPGTKNFSVSWVEPLTPEMSMRRFRTMTPDNISNEREAARSKWGLEVLNEEDRQLCRSVQQGMMQRRFEMGYYIVDPERGNLSEDTVRYFHQLYVNHLFAA